MEPEIFNNLPKVIHWLATALSFSLLLGRIEMTMLPPFAIQDCGENWMDVFGTVKCFVDITGKWLWKTKGQVLGAKKDMAKVRGHHSLPPAQLVQKPTEVGTVWSDPNLTYAHVNPYPMALPLTTVHRKMVVFQKLLYRSHGGVLSLHSSFLCSSAPLSNLLVGAIEWISLLETSWQILGNHRHTCTFRLRAFAVAILSA